MSGFRINVYEADTVKSGEYSDAFANVPCECCDTIQPVYWVHAHYGAVTILRAAVTHLSIEGAVSQALHLAEILGPRIDAAEMAWRAEEEDRRMADLVVEDQDDKFVGGSD